MRHHRLFAAGLAAALMLGAAAPALAAPGKGKAKGHVNKPTKTKPAPPATKGKKVGISGGGAVAGTTPGEFSIQARPNSKAKGHFNYTSTDETIKIRCKGFEGYTAHQTTPASASATFKNCRATGIGDNPPTNITVTVTDTGKSTVAPPAPDQIDFTAGTLDVVNAPLTGGNVKIRP